VFLSVDVLERLKTHGDLLAEMPAHAGQLPLTRGEAAK
jgi:hypothetical protein